MRNHPVVQNHYNQPGLNGFFGDLLKGIASAAGALIGGVVGAVVVSVAMYGIDRYINGNENASMTMFGIKILGPSYALNAPSGIITGSTIFQPRNKELEEWVQNKFQPYILALAKTLNYNDNVSVLKSSAYRAKVNEVIQSLSVAAYYYENQAKGLNGLIDAGQVEINPESRATVIYSFINAIKEAYQLALKESGVEPSAGINTINVQSYFGKKLESYNWSGNAQIQIEVFVEPGTGEEPTTITGIKQEDIKKSKDKTKGQLASTDEVIKTVVTTTLPEKGDNMATGTPPPNTEETPSPTATVETGKTKNASILGWGLAALIGGALMFKKKNKKK